MLGNITIKELVEKKQLIQNFDENCLKNSSYKLRIGKLIKPNCTYVMTLDNVDNSKWYNKLFRSFSNIISSKQKKLQFDRINNRYELKPNELIIFQTAEKVKIPITLSASYSALDSVAKRGLLLINASMVEPGYTGYLSGVLLNFSSKSFFIQPNMEIAKINFFKVVGGVENNLNESVTHYTEMLQEKAQFYTQTFLDIDRIENEVIAKTASSIKKSFVFGGLVLGFILAFCTIEPVLYKYVWHDSWVPLNSTQIELERSLFKAKEMLIIDSLKEKVDSLQKYIEEQNVRNKDIKPRL